MPKSISQISPIASGCPWPAKVVQTSTNHAWNDIVIERHIASPEEQRAEVMPMHVISLLANASSKFERKDPLGRWTRYIKTSGAMTLTPAGSLTTFSLRTTAELIHVGLNGSFVRRVADELEGVPNGDPFTRVGVRDNAIFQIVSLLKAELESESQLGRLYVDSLANALAVRFLVAASSRSSRSASKVRALPSRILERVREKMQANIGEDLSLDSLARETGYSNAHFLRMFHASTGNTPYRFLLELRLERARELLSEGRSASIVMIAGDCGFSTQAHFTSMFRRRFGVTPAQFRRTLGLRKLLKS